VGVVVVVVVVVVVADLEIHISRWRAGCAGICFLQLAK
jgi:hypothetical protein